MCITLILLTLQYLCWRVLTGQHNNITLSFLVAGHTKFSPDWCFGLAKQKLRKTKVGCLADIATTIDQSATSNTTQLAGTEDGIPIVTTYDWVGYLASHFRRIPHIKRQHHFMLTSESKGYVTLKEYSDSEEVKFKMLKDDWSPSATDLPPVITPPGLSPERQWYLHDSIREYCPDYCKNVVCPLPSVPKPRKSAPPSPAREPEEEIEDEETESLQPRPAKRARTCSVCGETGHNARRHQ